MLLSGYALGIELTGAGATFPYPVYGAWAAAYEKASGVKLNYQSIGSSGGVRQIKAKTVDFGATDAPLSPEDLDKSGLLQFPAIIGGTVPVFNLEGFKAGELRLSGAVLADIFLGNITNWDDPKIRLLNPGKKFPNQAITVVHRADGSGTTFNFTDYLTSVSKDWANQVGKGSAVKWLAPTTVGGKGNEGVAANVLRLNGSVGYVEYAYVKKNKMLYFSMTNADGYYVEPKDDAFAFAASSADWFSVKGMGISMIGAKGAKSWPISTASFILLQKENAKPENIQQVLKFFDWSFKNGKSIAENLDYVPLPDNVAQYIRKEVWAQLR
ncbi:MAG: phosphate ABC transporter substrate-binding protein PstS [Gammaproteobacteria bacterium]|nr:phosphate ABC transporter substrate-binding protein PstS [Gammaproteobacteria bacterium]